MPLKTRKSSGAGGPAKAPEPDLFGALEPPPLPTPTNQPAPETPEQAPDFSGRFAEIAVEGPVRGTFTYRLPEGFARIQPGAFVLVPFGRQNKFGYFLGELDADAIRAQGINPAKLKSVLRIVSGQDDKPLLTPQLIALARWMSRRYAAPLGATLSAMAPAGVKRGAAGARVRMVAAGKTSAELQTEAEARATKRPAQAAILRELLKHAEAIPAAALLAASQASDAALKTLAKAGLVTLSEMRPDDGLSDGDDEGDSFAEDLKLNDEQQAALTRIQAPLHAQKFAGFLLQGVTGSGKTEVYLRALKTALALGKQGIVLVPEIALTPQTARRFQQRLGAERVAVLHSHVTGGERADAWRLIRAGKIDVVVGARSALFAPLPRLGIVIIDEEHENAFKQESTPRYHARDAAAELARLSQAVLVLGSATPSFETLYGAQTGAAQTGKLEHLHLTQRVAGRPMPPVEIIDLNQENMETEKYTYLSRRLIGALDRTLHRGEQAILFMNRRGFATVLTCLRCGYTEKCEQCDITLTSHRGAVNMRHGAPAAPVASPVEARSSTNPASP